MTREEFLKVAKERFGDKINVGSLTLGTDDERIPWTEEEIAAYPAQAWIVPEENGNCLCPGCGWPLGGIFGSFSWGITHGIGQCFQCEKIQVRYYHYIVKGRKPLEGFALVGFAEGL